MHKNTALFLHNFLSSSPLELTTQRAPSLTTNNIDKALAGSRLEEQKNNTPFFLVGCVRSGTTLLRDLLRMHPRLEGPEESHFFRWADPFATPRYKTMYENNGDLKTSRRLDEISEEEFFTLFSTAQNRKELQDAYCQLYLKKQDNPDGRWFDKTPQNLYGLFLLKEAYPDAIFIHIHRNPLNVAASLRKGMVMPSMTITAAINYWNDSYIMLREFSKLYPESVYEIPYLSLTTDPQGVLNNLLTYLGEDSRQLSVPEGYVYTERNAYKKTLVPKEQTEISNSCADGMKALGYT